MPIIKTSMKLDLLTKLSKTQKERNDGDKGKTLKEVMREIGRTINKNK